MPQRFDYFDDPAAPPPTSVVPSATAFVQHAGRVLMIERTDNGHWSMPGGALDLGESLPECAVRETREESGIDVEIVGLIGIYSDPRHLIHYTSDDEVRQEFTVVYRARPNDPDQPPKTSSESSRVEWIDVSEMPNLPMDRSQRLRIEHALNREGPWLG
ncbi:NUDIX hydrolase [Luteipulveratus mongoliensis]|uniref:NUDIX hydrolase n=1 Tax=Luteipulveratus mongoliensis TaxID=571913 RepID=A0A0K1JE36_9MICO|nr:NUDIX domain-containing protein [Luteipulveratus mongoliensis]AKU14850.1 NUDIX hydrolase [Luteipulveratus mongoliensis]